MTSRATKSRSGTAAAQADHHLARKYQSKTQYQHIRDAPETYIGSINLAVEERWVPPLVTLAALATGELEIGDLPPWRMEYRSVQLVPGLLKIFDEVIVNALDHVTRTREAFARFPGGDTNIVKRIDVSVDRATGQIIVENDGDGIDVEYHPTVGFDRAKNAVEVFQQGEIIPTDKRILIPELIFGSLLTSTNYDKEEEKTVAGKNGYGAKLTAIFSREFIVETIDHKRKKHFRQAFHDNMIRREIPTVTPAGKMKPFTRFTFTPDYSQFNLPGMTDDLYAVIFSRVLQAAATTPVDVVVSWNRRKIPIRGLEKFVDMFVGSKDETARVYGRMNDRWEFAVAPTPIERFSQISFVNGCNTVKGGKHVDRVVEQIVTLLVEHARAKNKVELKPSFVRESLMVFVNTTVVNPSFDSQCKETLTTSYSKMKAEFDLLESDEFVTLRRKIVNLGIIDSALEALRNRETAILARTEGRNKRRTIRVEKLDDADAAGTEESLNCTLILTEGDSAKGTALAGRRGRPDGNRYFGVFPLKGKLLNVRGMPAQKVRENKEIAHIITILGLDVGRRYETIEAMQTNLRYGHVMILSDQDYDGAHIRGLIINLFAVLWPDLYRAQNFIQTMLTPNVKATKGRECIAFYSLADFNYWRSTIPPAELTRWKIKYYKGLGTSSPKEAIDYFREMRTLRYVYTPTSDNIVDMAFNKKRAHDRKTWLGNFNIHHTLDYTTDVIPYEEFVNLELIHFSNADNERSIPNVLDGLKPGQRKPLYGAFLRRLRNEIKVEQLAGYISENCAYHHGGASLVSTIVSMAQNFVGADNINVFYPQGQFGTRVLGGKDSASERYICTYLTPISWNIYDPADFKLLPRAVDDDGNPVEPINYIPIIPMLLVNGSRGIGTGFSTYVPRFDPAVLITLLRDKLEGRPSTHPLIPYYQGFKGTIVQLDAQHCLMRGVYEQLADDVVRITEIPVETWTENYKKKLETMLVDYKPPNARTKTRPYLRDINTSGCNDIEVNIVLKFIPGKLRELLSEFVSVSSLADAADDEIDQDGGGGGGGVGEDTESVTSGTGVGNHTHSTIMISLFESEFGLAKKISYKNMWTFDETGHLRKFATPYEILDYYFVRRLAAYDARKNSILADLERERLIANAKYTFISDYISKKLAIIDVEDDVLLQQLLKANYPRISKSTGQIIMPGTNPDGSIIDEEIVQPDIEHYKYLLDMPIRTLTRKRMEVLAQDLTKINYDISVLSAKTGAQIWLEDLNSLEHRYREFCDDRTQQYSSGIESVTTQKPRKRTTTRNTNKK